MLTAEYRMILYGLVLLADIAVFAKVRSRRVRQSVLLVASYGLYASWGLWFAAVPVFSTVMNFSLGQWLRRTQRSRTTTSRTSEGAVTAPTRRRSCGD